MLASCSGAEKAFTRCDVVFVWQQGVHVSGVSVERDIILNSTWASKFELLAPTFMSTSRAGTSRLHGGPA